MTVLSPFGKHLRLWRKQRGLSQLSLAMLADTTPRYMSFIETGRSRPGRDIVLRLAQAMDLPLRDRNILLNAAGFSPAFSEKTLDDASMKPVRRIIDHVLHNHNPYPACSMAPGLRFLKLNRTAERIFPGIADLSPEEIIDTWFAPGNSDVQIENWKEVAHAGLAELRQESLHHPHPNLTRLLKRAESHIAELGPPPTVYSEVPIMRPILMIEGQRVRTIATVMRFDKATDITTAEIRVELMFPADDASEAFFKALAAR